VEKEAAFIKDLLRTYAAVQTPKRSSGTFTQPAIAFEKATGLNGISQTYRLPGDVTIREIQGLADVLRVMAKRGEMPQETATDHLRRVAAAIEALNPDIVALRFDRDNPQKLFDVLLGVASAFNPQDIQYYLDGNTAFSSYSIPSYHEKILRIHGPIDWAPCPETLDLILEKQRIKLDDLFAPQRLRQENPFLV
jgi:hypothetical protein